LVEPACALRFSRAQDPRRLQRAQVLGTARAVERSSIAGVQFEEGSVHRQVVTLLEGGRVQQARELAAGAGGEWAEVLRPPQVRVGREAAPGSEARFAADRAWLRENGAAAEYRGKWVALRRGELLGADESRRVLHRRLQQTGSLHEVMFVRVA
tara:strand:+ start:3584 stop:4045 length:462 start_codon:yes stop_codon:yes gene_type:complete